MILNISPFIYEYININSIHHHQSNLIIFLQDTTFSYFVLVSNFRPRPFGPPRDHIGAFLADSPICVCAKNFQSTQSTNQPASTPSDRSSILQHGPLASISQYKFCSVSAFRSDTTERVPR